MRRREFIWLAGGAAAWPLRARAQRRAPTRRIGILILYVKGNPEGEALLASFRDGMAKLGWNDGQNVTYEYRWVSANPLVLQELEQAAKDLVASHPDIILSSSSPGTAVLLQTTRTIPIVFAQVVDPVGQGFVASLSRPGRNATGLVNLETSMAGKWIELLKDVVPSLARVAVPFNPSSAPYADFYLSYFHSAAASFGVQVVAQRVTDLAALETFAASPGESTDDRRGSDAERVRLCPCPRDRGDHAAASSSGHLHHRRLRQSRWIAVLRQ
jgi:putative tryptophan/tyrosine transport system substrate-binding protein